MNELGRKTLKAVIGSANERVCKCDGMSVVDDADLTSQGRLHLEIIREFG